MPTHNVRDHGAVGDGQTLDTRAIQAAIDAAAEFGGRVAVPAGTYLTGTVVLRSRVTLDLEPGAALLGSSNLEDYITRIWGHHNDITPWHLVLAEDVEDVTITGGGVIDGNGPAWWEPDRRHDWDFWKAKVRRVSPMVECVRCTNLRIENVTLRQSAGWTLHLHDCDGVKVRGINIRNTFFGPNTDGIDITGSHDVTVSDCDIKTGDDAIAIKANEYSRSNENITISNCLLQTSCVGVRLGFESRQDFRHIAVSNCVVPRCSRVIDLRSVEGAVIEHVSFSNIVASTNSGWPVNRPIEVILASKPNTYAHGLCPEHPDYGKDKPLLKQGAIRDISFSDIDILTDGRITICAEDDHEIDNICFRNLHLRYAMLDDPSPYGGAESTGFLPAMPEPRTVAAAIVVRNAARLRFDGLRISWPRYPVPDDWYLLESPQRLMNAAFYEGHEEAIRRGEKRIVFKALWARDLRDSRIDLRGITASDGTTPAQLIDSDPGQVAT